MSTPIKKPLSRVRLWLGVGQIILAVALLAFTTAINLQYQEQKEQVASTSVQRDATASQATELADKVSADCDTKVAKPDLSTCVKARQVQQAVPQIVQQPVPSTPIPVVVGPSDIQIQAQLTLYCSVRGDCKGADGAAPDVNAIIAAVKAQIPTPSNGADGKSGTDGKDAPAITADQLAAVVSTYCGQDSNPCIGKTGAKGDKGDTVAGPAGRGIKSTNIETSGGCHFHVEYTDGTSQDIAISSTVCAP